MVAVSAGGLRDESLPVKADRLRSRWYRHCVESGSDTAGTADIAATAATALDTVGTPLSSQTAAQIRMRYRQTLHPSVADPYSLDAARTISSTSYEHPGESVHAQSILSIRSIDACTSRPVISMYEPFLDGWFGLSLHSRTPCVSRVADSFIRSKSTSSTHIIGYPCLVDSFLSAT